jgi:SAM-dependent methyltransferase
MAKKITGAQTGLEYALIILNFLFKSKALHYGYWEPGDEVHMFDFGKAQEKYTDVLMRHVPPDARDVLDVGCGTGVIAQRLIARGHSVECLSPSAFLNQIARADLPATTTVHESTFEGFQTDRQFDLVMFAESFQYVQMRESLEKVTRLLRPGGRLLICDVFRLDRPDRGPIGGGRYYSEFLKLRDELGFRCVTDVDITANIAPTFDLVNDLSLNLLKPVHENFLRVMKTNHPVASKAVLWTFRKKLRKAQRHFNPKRNGASFRKYKTYRIQVLTRDAGHRQ